MAQFTRTTQCLKFSCYELCKFQTGVYVCWITFFGHRQLVNHLFYEKLHHQLAHWSPIHWDMAISWVFIDGIELYKLFKTQNMAAEAKALTQVPY